ncbi:TetR/AcrR family transcriptional regulator [Kitasatospora acidiphila]|uniref:TetR/AcrR family transcriptional regulator n=1 Tax=Kitasatospora acidiphila TaxID=2567942 RepID=A0A540WBH0_9ACTN|nr:TetR/AcrR family transcriptional regulator [Kitasatospora acidiphila]TQF06353.1 TetR/AcrR family transcriptional regulator [Kitasatospora acidiphila]
MSDMRTGAPRGRRREADDNDLRLLQAAREVFAEQGWEAPVSAIARRAGIGMGSLYRRYPSKEQLAQRMRIVGMEQLIALADTARAEESEPWAAFARFLHDALSAQGLGAPLLPVLGGRLPATDEVDATADRLRTAFDALVGSAHRAGVLRADFTSADLPLLLEHLTARLPVPAERAAELNLRHLDVVLGGLRTSATSAPTALPGPAPDWAELRELWNAPAG